MSIENNLETPIVKTEDANKLLHDIRETVEKENKCLNDTVQKVEKMAADLEPFAKKIDEVSAKQVEQKKVIDALQRQAINITTKANGEVEILNPELVDAYQKYFYCSKGLQMVSQDPMVNKYYHASAGSAGAMEIKLPAFARDGKSLVPYGNIEQKYLRTDIGDAGGFLVPPEFMPIMLRRLTEVSPVRQYATGRTTYSNVLQVPVRNVLLTGSWGNQGLTPLLQSQSQYLRPEIHMKRMNVTVPISIEELMDSPFDMQAEISNDVNESYAQMEGYGFVKGDGVHQVEGIMTNSQVKEIATGKASDITADSITQMFGEIKWQSYGSQNYDRTYMFNRRTWIKILQLKDGQGRYIWSLGNIQAGMPNTILGANYIIAPDMDDVSANLHPIVMGDFKKGYMIVDRMLMYMVRDEVTMPGYINFSFIRRLGAQVVMPEAFIKLKVATSV